MSDPEVAVELGLRDELRDQAVAVYEEAFGEKMRTAVRDQQKRMAFIERALVAANLLVARHGDELLGAAGLSSKGAPFAGGTLGSSWDPRPYRDLLGWTGALWAVWGSRMADHEPTADELYVDGIAVASRARGLGIGTRLLAEIRQTARSHGKRYVRLDVIDTNPRAQALYERVGYRVTRVQSFRWKQRWVGFGAMLSMEQPVDPDEPAAS
jgi:ribosomal protein S18 acetylase RimI-like enzyme